MRRRTTRRVLKRVAAGSGHRPAVEVEVTRIAWGSTYARVSTIGHRGERAFVLVPGIGVSSNYFERLAAQLNDIGPVHALDLPGFGGVPHPKSRQMTIGEYADLVGTVIDRLGLADPVVLGHSMGTQVVADLAARYPDGFAGAAPLSAIVLLGPVVNPDERTVPRTSLRFLQVARREPPRVAVLALNAYLLCGVRWFSRVLPEMMHYRIEETLPRVRSRTLVISGELDTLCPPGWLDRVTELLPHGRVSVIPGAAHSIMHAHADRVAALTLAHLRTPGDQRLPDPPVQSNAPESDRVAEAAGLATELGGILTDDDKLIAEGKTKQARALDPSTGDPVEGPTGGS